MNAATKVTMTTPPFFGSRRRMSSGTLRGRRSSAAADECEKITGASATRSASSMVSGETWERSTSMPSRFISRTTSSPNVGEAAVARGVAGASPPSRA